MKRQMPLCLATIKQDFRVAAFQTGVEILALYFFYMTNAKQDIRGDIAVMRRTVEKADTEVFKPEEDRQKQDLYVHCLTETVERADCLV
ncbi:coiled-coil domain-containing protein 40-like [Lytechinus pictus]|uniref:coiled-coil domain-containing protein 40-like n=1 Tax=Lytechinus pictus TaxID=7653 RepID=UPI0030B9B4B3